MHSEHVLLMYFRPLGPQNHDFYEIIMPESAWGLKVPGKADKQAGHLPQEGGGDMHHP